MALTKEKSDQFFAENQADFEALCRLFLAAADDPDHLAYLMTCIERVATLTFQAIRSGEKTECISWQ